MNNYCKRLLIWVDEQSSKNLIWNGPLMAAYVGWFVYDTATTPAAYKVHAVWRLLFDAICLRGKVGFELYLLVGCLMTLSVVAVAKMARWMNWPVFFGRIHLSTIMLAGMFLWLTLDAFSVFSDGEFVSFGSRHFAFSLLFTFVFLRFKVPVFVILLTLGAAFFKMKAEGYDAENIQSQAQANRRERLFSQGEDPFQDL